MNKLLSIFLCLLWTFVVATDSLADRHTETRIDFNILLQQAELAHASYLSVDKIQNTLKRYDYSLDINRRLDESQVSFFLATRDIKQTQAIVVRGTANLENVLVNISLELLADESTGLVLHRGYTETAKKIIAALKPSLKKDHVINTIGHSLGGAIALIMATMLDQQGYKIDQVVTFGQPKVSNITAAEKMRHLSILRVVTATDPVPLLPLLDPLDINNLKIYWHAGIELLLLDGRQYAIIDKLTSMLRAADFSPQAMNDEGLHQHRMQAYLDQLETKTSQAERVEYQAEFSLFRLFVK